VVTAPPRRRRRAFSLNGLAIQVSAFALSFTLVALLVVGSSRAAFVEQNEAVTERVPVDLPQPDPAPWVPGDPVRPAPITTPATEDGPPPPAEPSPEPVAQLLLSDDSAGTAMFTDEQGLAPGQPEQRCIRVTLDGDVRLSQPVVLYAAEARGALAQYLDLIVEEGPDGGRFGDCSAFVPGDVLFRGTLADFGARHARYESGLRAWSATGSGESRSFRFTLSVRDVPEAEGLSVGFGFTWEARG
jgi:hypothetical protein